MGEPLLLHFDGAQWRTPCSPPGVIPRCPAHLVEALLLGLVARAGGIVLVQRGIELSLLLSEVVALQPGGQGGWGGAAGKVSKVGSQQPAPSQAIQLATETCSQPGSTRQPAPRPPSPGSLLQVRRLLLPPCCVLLTVLLVVLHGL